MNLLQLAQRLRQEVGASGNDNTTVNAQGEWKRLVDWVVNAWVDIQEEETEWDFMREDFSFVTIPGQATYAPDAAPLSLTDFRRWMNNTFRLQQTGIGDELFMNQLPYDSFRNIFQFGTYRDQEAVPYAISIHPSKSLILGPKPIGTYNVLGQYYKLPESLADDADEPSFPERYHMLIIYRAMQFYGMYEAAQEVIARAGQEYSRIMDRMRQDQLQPASVHRGFL